jgi:GNAT superfamily N-acetyltransferase
MSNDHGAVPESSFIRDQIHDLIRWTLTALAERATEFEHGFAVRTGSLPWVWTLNQVRITGSVSPDEVDALASQFQGDLPFRHVVVEGDLGAALVDPLGATGWWSEREVVMAMTRPVDREVDTSRVVELSETQMLALMRDWLREEREGITDDGLDQVGEYNRLEGKLFNETRLGVVEGGTPLAVTKLRARDGIAWVEDVYTAPTWRGQGIARALIAEAVERAWLTPPRFAYIIADDNDWPKDFYSRAGFEPVAYNYTFHRDHG